MKKFMDEDFLLESETAKKLYHDYAEQMPIIDYHCHVNPKDIAEDLQYDNISDVWLGGDHYKWRLMRANGSMESDITGARGNDPYGLFLNFAKAMSKAIGNPVFHWAQLELKRYFDVDKILSEETAEEIYNKCNERLTDPGMSVRGMINKYNVKLICTTDDPIDNLEWHEKIKADESCEIKVLPAFRPDKLIRIEKEGFADYIKKLEEVIGKDIETIEDVKCAIDSRIDYFDAHGCKASDHALDYCLYEDSDETELNAILNKALSGEKIDQIQADKYKTAILVYLAEKYAEKNWVMQIHFGCLRDNNSKMMEALGPDTGFDSMNGDGRPAKLASFLDKLYADNKIPKMILYSLNPQDSETLVSVAGCFMSDAGCPGKIQVGSAWWYNDTKPGMLKQLSDFANGSLLGAFVGMLTDSRSFLSYTRHEYFRRILCNYIGGLVESGEYPYDEDALKNIVQDICFNNAKEFFGFEM